MKIMKMWEMREKRGTGFPYSPRISHVVTIVLRVHSPGRGLRGKNFAGQRIGRREESGGSQRCWVSLGLGAFSAGVIAEDGGADSDLLPLPCP